MNRPALGIHPPLNFSKKIKDVLFSVRKFGIDPFIRGVNKTTKSVKVAPKGLNMVQTMACGSCANENAYKAVFIRYNTKIRKEKPPYTQQELQDCVVNAGTVSVKQNIDLLFVDIKIN